MRCTNCQAELIPGKRFCHRCGAPSGSRCRSCGSALRPEFRFCPDCGSAVAGDEPAPLPVSEPPKLRATRGPVSGERKQVTVLFCDLANSTEIAEPLDPEEYRELLDRYLAIVMGEIERHGGGVNQLAGDGLMALFGAPIASEDAPERAVSAALAIQTALGRFSDGRLASRGIELEARVGIHTGLAVVGTVGTDAKMDYTAIGDTTNLASRLESLAQPGTILVSADTHRLLEGRFRAEPVGPFEIKGKAEPVTAYQICCEYDVLEPRLHALTPLVGRQGHLAQLLDSFRHLGQGLAQMVAVIGEAGSGKSRLIHEFKQGIAREQVILLEARCSSLSQTMPDYVWITMLERHFEIQPADTPQARRDKVAHGVREWDPNLDEIYPFVCRMLSIPLDDGLSLPPAELRHEVFRAISRLIMGLMQRAPVVMVVEDLHWIDEVSRQDLELAAGTLDGPVMLVVSHRPDYQPHWSVRAAFTQLSLGPLSDLETATIVEALAGGPIPAELRERVLEKAEGNPFYAEEITRALIESGDLVAEDGAVELTRPVEEIPIPSTVQEVLGARLDRLAPAAKRVAQAASVLGRQFGADPLKQLLAGESIEVEAELAELERRGVVYRGGQLAEGIYRFGESLTQEVAYESLLLRERRRLHGELAALLEESREGHTPERATLLAHHYTRSDDRSKALRAVVTAAVEAEAVPSYARAVEFYREAWTLAEEILDGPEGSHEEDLRAAAAAAIGIGRFDAFSSMIDAAEGRRAFERGAALAEELCDDVSLAELLSLRGLFLTNGGPEEFAEGTRLAERACEVAQNAGIAVPALRASRTLGWIYQLDARLDDAMTMLQEVVRGFEELGHRETLSDAYLGSLLFRDRAFDFTETRERAEAQSAESLKLARRASNRTVASAMLSRLARTALDRGELETAIQLGSEAAELASEISNLAAQRNGAAVTIIASAEAGRGVAESLLQALLGALDRDSDVAIQADLVIDALLAAGKTEHALELARRARAAAGGRLRVLLSDLAFGRALASQAEPDLEAARRSVESALALAEELHVKTVIANAATEAGELALALGDTEAAVSRLTRGREVSRSLGLTRVTERATALLAAAETRIRRRDLH